MHCDYEQDVLVGCSVEDYDEFDEIWNDNEQRIIDIIGEIDEHARECIDRFFVDKTWYLGGTIPQRELFSQEKIDIIEQIELEDAVSFFYNIVEQTIQVNPSFTLCGATVDLNIDNDLYENINGDTNVVLSIMRECEIKRIPQNRIGGILLIFLDVVAGIQLDWSAVTEIVRASKIKHTEDIIIKHTEDIIHTEDDQWA